MYDVGMRREKGVSLNLLESLGDRLSTEGTPYLLQREEGRCCRILNQVDIGEATL